MTTIEHNTATPLSYAMFLTIICLIAFGCFTASYMRLPIVPLYAKSLGIDIAHIGIINSFFFMTAGILSLPIGILSDQLGRKRLAVLGLILLSGTSFLLCISETHISLCAVYFIYGVGMALFGPTMMSLVADFSPLTHLGRSYGWYTTALYSGMSLGPALGGFVAENFGFTRVFLLSGSFLLVNICITLIFLPSPGRIHASGSKTQIFLIIKQDIIGNRPLLGCWAATLGGAFGLGTFMTFVPLHARNQGLKLDQIGIIFFIQGLVNALSRIPLGYLSDKVDGRQKLVVLGLTGFSASVAGFGMSVSLNHFIICAVAMGLSMALAFTSVGALLAETVPPGSRGLAMGGYNAMIYIGMMICSALMGYIIQKTGFNNGFLIAAVIIVALIALFYYLMGAKVPDCY
ncbi:Major facilitator superfamily transporter [Desulfonema limicola]|uniref:Major facilitator superfamily transporter n=2 Tax=Desulfonema limicola TaxID=45656 RepID=A0A975BA86_9BACT|nr:Major facilitator superfamily transporter [Desulfonema limicola]